MATTYDKASLVMIPSGYKDDKLYSIKPTDGSGDFTFSRDGAGASPATRVNASGLIEKGRTNDLLQSNTFSNASWTKVDSSETSGQTGYDGSSDAWLIDKSAANGRIQQSQTGTGVQTFSVYAKAGTLNYMRLRAIGSSNPSCFFDFTDGSIHNNDGFAASMTSVGGDWYRCSYSFVSSLTEVQIYPADSTSSVAGTSGNIFIQDAQVESGLVATDYIETTTAPVSAGLLGDMPRLDYSGGASCPSLLLEPSRVNILESSEYVEGAGWSLSGTPVISQNFGISPEGVQNSVKVEDNTSGGYEAITNATTLTSGISYSGSFFIKKATSAVSHYAGFTIGGFPYIIIDTYNGTHNVDGGTGSWDSINIDSFNSEWWLFSATMTATASGTASYSVWPAISANGTTISATATGEQEFYGFQMESGSYPTSYIPTYGSASTRGADLGYVTGISDLIGQTEGTIFAEFEIPQDFYTTEDYRFSIGDGGINNWIFVSIYNTDNIRVFVRTASTTSIDEAELGVISHGTTYKVALAYKSGSTSCYLNGTEIISSSATISAPSASLSNLNLTGDSSIQTSSPQTIGVNLKQRLQFKTRLTNAELAALTTI